MLVLKSPAVSTAHLTSCIGHRDRRQRCHCQSELAAQLQSALHDF